MISMMDGETLLSNSSAMPAHSSDSVVEVFETGGDE
jgi:hypothetical protein